MPAHTFPPSPTAGSSGTRARRARQSYAAALRAELAVEIDAVRAETEHREVVGLFRFDRVIHRVHVALGMVLGEMTVGAADSAGTLRHCDTPSPRTRHAPGSGTAPSGTARGGSHS